MTRRRLRLRPRLPHGEMASEQVESGIEAMMASEPLFPIVERPSNPDLAWLLGLDDPEDDQ